MGKASKSIKDPVAYQSSLRADEVHPSVVTYVDSKTGQDVGRVYKNHSGRWFLASRYLNHYQPVEVFTKYGGFLFLLSLHRKFYGEDIT